MLNFCYSYSDYIFKLPSIYCIHTAGCLNTQCVLCTKSMQVCFGQWTRRSPCPLCVPIKYRCGISAYSTVYTSFWVFLKAYVCSCTITAFLSCRLCRCADSVMGLSKLCNIWSWTGYFLILSTHRKPQILRLVSLHKCYKIPWVLQTLDTRNSMDNIWLFAIFHHI